jgi:hypothetical protein
MDRVTVTATVPAGTALSPRLSPRGARTDRRPLPHAGRPAPPAFIGVVERTWRAALGVAGRQGPLDLRASAGLHHVVNSDHEEGRTVDRFEGRLQATLGLSRGGSLR